MAAAAFPIVGLNESERYMRERFGISAAVLKWIAVVSMVIDHFACSVYPCLNGYDIGVYHILRGIGRIAFPIYCYLLEDEKRNKLNVDLILNSLGMSEADMDDCRVKAWKFQKQVTGRSRSMSEL